MFGRPKTQTGVALFISLVMLLVLTIIGISSVQTTSLEVRMTRNEHDSILAFQAAESALRDAEAVIETLASTADFTDAGNNGFYNVADLGVEQAWQDDDIWANGNSRETETEIENVAAQPRYIIEYVASVLREANAYQLDDPYAASGGDRVEIFRITARGTGGTVNSQVTLQSNYGRILD
ncbi:MAG: PilX N-terminal domain-containing pilus assembly protein [Pseudomonadales bacterium]|nr:PilX N-terminal domain-containing pilus assembly protein [Pseudomonadales bacterium]